MITWRFIVVVPVKMSAPKRCRGEVKQREDQGSSNAPQVPYFDRSVFATSDKPLSLTMKRDRSHIHSVSVKRDKL